MTSPKRETDNLAIAIAGTRQSPNRLKVDRVTTARSLAALRKSYGSNREVGQRVGISAEMVRQFLAVLELSSPALAYWESGRITNVDMGYRISSRLPKKHHAAAARLVLKHKLTTQDVYDVTAYMKQNPRLSPQTAFERVMKSKDKVVYVADYTIDPVLLRRLRDAGMSLRQVWSLVRDRLLDAAGRANVAASQNHKHGLRLKFNGQGLRRLREVARGSRVRLSDLATRYAEELEANAQA